MTGSVRDWLNGQRAAVKALDYEHRVLAHRLPSGHFGRFHDKNSLHMDGCVRLVPLDDAFDTLQANADCEGLVLVKADDLRKVLNADFVPLNDPAAWYPLDAARRRLRAALTKGNDE